MNFNFLPQRDNRIPNLNASIKAQHKHEPTVRVQEEKGFSGDISLLADETKLVP